MSFVFFTLAIVLPAACGGSGEVQPAAAQPKVTGSGFVCPEPEFPVVVASTDLDLLVWTEYIPQDMIECFELVYGVSINRDEYSSNEEMYSKVSAGGTAYDLVQPTDYMVLPMVREGLLQELNHAGLPVLINYDPNYLDFEFDPGNRYTIPYLAGTDAIVVNVDAVEVVPQSWADLWDPDYAGRIVFLDDSRVAIGITLLTLGYDVNTTDPLQLNQAWGKLEELVPHIKIFDSDSPKTALIAGEVDLGLTWTGEAFLAKQENPAIEYIYPSEGAILWQDNWAILRDAPHPDAVYAWLNYSAQGNVSWMMLRDFPYTYPNKAALEYARENQREYYDAYMASSITNVPAAAIRKGHRIVDVGNAASLYEEIWLDVRYGD